MIRALLLTLTAVTLTTAAADAKSSRQVSRAFDKVWPTSVRHLRIDEGHKIVDKDSESGYIVFTVDDEGKTYRGALEFIHTKDREDRPVIELVLRIEDRPSYMEIAILDRLERKLRQEHGDEERSPSSPPPAKK